MKNILTPRQLQIIQLMVLGMSDKQILCQLGLKRKSSVSGHILRARDRLGVGTREQLIAQCVAQGLVSVPNMAEPVTNELNVSEEITVSV